MIQRTELLINISATETPEWVNIDLQDDIPIPLNYSIGDIRKPETRKGNFSKTINIPGTKNTNNIFTQIFKIEKDINSAGLINFKPDYNPNLKADIILKQDS